MVATLGRITAGWGYDYLTRSVATSRHDYYTGTGEAPGVWSGQGSALLGLAGVVDADDMAVLYGRFVDPRTKRGVRLPSGRWMPETILGQKVSVKTRADGTIAEPVAAFDATFSPAKSVSVLWATATDLHVRAVVLAAHEAAVTAGIGYLEVHAGHSRAGRNGVRRIAGQGLVIAQFRHRTARSTDPETRVGDPQLHSHCAILNRVRGVDGQWRTLDSRAIYRHIHAAGALYAAVLEHELTDGLGVDWAVPDGRVPMRDLAGVPSELVRLWSSRRQQVLQMFEQLLADWHFRHGRTPTRGERAGMLDDATIRSRQPKAGGDVDLHERWRSQLSEREQHQIDMATTSSRPAAGADMTGGRLRAGSDELAHAVVDALHEQRAWWTRAHVYAEVARLVAEPVAALIEVETERIVAGCVVLEADDDPVYAQADATKFTSTTILSAERRTLTAAQLPGPWYVDPVGHVGGLGDDQAGAVHAMTAGDRQLTTVIGPAGSGKTTMLKAAAAAYRAAGRPVTVLTLSAAAARVVTDETGLAASTIAAWRVGQVRLPRKGLLIIDEASMVPTLTLDQLVRLATAYRSRVALVGDYAQMGAPEAGGLLRDLAATPGAVHLTSVRRFHHQWERDASTRLRRRDPGVVVDYTDHERLHPATTDSATDQAAAGWFTDIEAGRDSLIVVDTITAAADVSARCQQLLTAAGRLGPRLATGADHNAVCIGDLIQTRLNTSDIVGSDGNRVLNRDVWRITGLTPDGSVTASNIRRAATITLPAGYVAAHVVLAYATTIAGAQGRTVDTGHTIVTPYTTAASLYVGMTRGRHANHAHVILDSHDHDELALGDRTLDQAFTAAVNRNADGQLSATAIADRWQTTAAQRRQDRDGDRAHLAATSWWSAYQRQLPPGVATALQPHQPQIIQLVVARPHDSWAVAARRAAATTNWTNADAGRQFLQNLQQGLRSARPTTDDRIRSSGCSFDR